MKKRFYFGIFLCLITDVHKTSVQLFDCLTQTWETTAPMFKSARFFINQVCRIIFFKEGVMKLPHFEVVAHIQQVFQNIHKITICLSTFGLTPKQTAGI